MKLLVGIFIAQYLIGIHLYHILNQEKKVAQKIDVVRLLLMVTIPKMEKL